MEKHPLNKSILTPQETQQELGRQIRSLRIRKNLDQIHLAERAGIAVTALKNLEAGHGSSLSTFIKTLNALEQAAWLETLAPIVSISPLQMLRKKSERVRASKQKSKP